MGLGGGTTPNLSPNMNANRAGGPHPTGSPNMNLNRNISNQQIQPGASFGTASPNTFNQQSPQTLSPNMSADNKRGNMQSSQPAKVMQQPSQQQQQQQPLYGPGPVIVSGQQMSSKAIPQPIQQQQQQRIQQQQPQMQRQPPIRQPTPSDSMTGNTDDDQFLKKANIKTDTDLNLSSPRRLPQPTDNMPSQSSSNNTTTTAPHQVTFQDSQSKTRQVPRTPTVRQSSYRSPSPDSPEFDKNPIPSNTNATSKKPQPVKQQPQPSIAAKTAASSVVSSQSSAIPIPGGSKLSQPLIPTAASSTTTTSSSVSGVSSNVTPPVLTISSSSTSGTTRTPPAIPKTHTTPSTTASTSISTASAAPVSSTPSNEKVISASTIANTTTLSATSAVNAVKVLPTPLNPSSSFVTVSNNKDPISSEITASLSPLTSGLITTTTNTMKTAQQNGATTTPQPITRSSAVNSNATTANVKNANNIPLIDPLQYNALMEANQALKAELQRLSIFELKCKSLEKEVRIELYFL